MLGTPGILMLDLSYLISAICWCWTHFRNRRDMSDSIRSRNNGSEDEGEKEEETDRRISRSLESLDQILKTLETIKTHPTWPARKVGLNETISMLDLRDVSKNETVKYPKQLSFKNLNSNSCHIGQTQDRRQSFR